MSDLISPSEIQKTREKAGKTRADLASALGVSEKSIQRWENDEVAIDRRTVMALRQVFAEWQQAGSKRSRTPALNTR